jgi:quercetin dioxygenase-like cupin family protein
MYRILIGGLVAMSMKTSAGAEKPLEVLGESVIIKVSGKETGDELSVLEIVTPPGLGAPPHANTREIIIFFVAEGTVTFTVEGDSVEQQAGVVVMIPRGVMHTYTNTGDKPSRLIATFAPGGFDRFLVELYERAFVMPDDMPAFVQLAAEYGVEIPAPQADD